MPDLLNPADDLANFDLLRGAIYTDPRNDANYPLRALPRPMSHTAARGLQQWATFAANDQVFYFPASQVPGVDCRDPDGVLHDAHGDRYAYVISEPILGGELWLWVGRREADPALAAYWKLDDKNPALTAGTIVDDVGDAHLTRGGDLLLPAASVPGIIDDALQFSGVIGGTGPRLTLPSGALPNINPLTIALWLKPAASVAMTLLDFGPLVLRHDGTKLHLTQGFSTTGGAWSKTCPLT
ncbi:MAG TPA: hypothetical protein PKC18_20905, partial [Lacipirellulaceae bacterium]|nr:hypothetical protein [Lacipirellulaceae bacterium]